MHKIIEIFSDMLFKEEFYDSDNLLTVCRGCGEKAWLPKDIKHEKKCVVSIAIKAAQEILEEAASSTSTNKLKARISAWENKIVEWYLANDSDEEEAIDMIKEMRELQSVE